MGIHTALDTNGYFGDRLTDAELETIDLVLLDIKTWDPERHIAADGHGHRADARVRPAAGRAQAADVGALRPGAGADRRPRGHRADRRLSPPASATSSAWTCCRSTRWAGTSGSSSASTTRSRTLEPPTAEVVERTWRSSGAQGSRPTDPPAPAPIPFTIPGRGRPFAARSREPRCSGILPTAQLAALPSEARTDCGSGLIPESSPISRGVRARSAGGHERSLFHRQL